MVIENVPVMYNREQQIIRYTAGMRIDNDGARDGGEGDRYHQSQTSYKYPNGASLNAYKTPFIVMPIPLVKAVKPACLGSRAVVEYRGQKIETFVGDLGGRDPKTNLPRIGEGSVWLAELLGIPSSPTKGGTSGGVTYTIYLNTHSKIIDGYVYTPRMWDGK